MSWFINSIRLFFGTLDSIIYNLMAVLYQLLMDLAHINILSNNTVTKFYTKIYVLLGLFMLVKVSFSFINYIVNPDSFFDKQKGAQKVLVNIILSLTMLTVLPFAFKFLTKAQNAILDDDIIPMFFLGSESDDASNNKFYISDVCKQQNEMAATAVNRGDFIAILAFRPFYQLNDDLPFDTEAVSLARYCAPYPNAKISNYLVSDIVNDGKEKNKETSLLAKFFTGAVLLKNGDVDYYVEYKFFISTICGAFICLILISFCFDIAVRSIKLGFLQLIAPIPVISYIDPKSGKDGMFNKWLKMVGSTWADLFIRLASIFLAIFIVSLVASEEIELDGYSSSKFWLVLFIILGALMFAKKLPELIENIFGLKVSGSFQLNPFKKIQNEALFGKQLVGGAGALAAGAGGLVGGAAIHGLATANQLHKIGKNKMDLKAGLRNQRQLYNENEARAKAEKTAEHEKKQAENMYSLKKDKLDKLNSAEKRALESQKNAKTQAEKDAAQKMLDGINKQKTQVKNEEYRARKDLANKTSNYNNAKSEHEVSQKKFDKQVLANQGINDKIAELKDSKLYRRPIWGTVAETSTSAYSALKHGYKDPSHLVKDVLDGTKSGANMRNYYEEFNANDRIRDRYTDFVGIKNDSGTTSDISKEIKKETDALSRIEQYIRALNNNLGSSQNFTAAVNITDDGKYEFNTNYTGSDAAYFKQGIDKWNEALDKQIQVQSHINKLKGMQERGKRVGRPMDKK